MLLLRLLFVVAAASLRLQASHFLTPLLARHLHLLPGLRHPAHRPCSRRSFGRGRSEDSILTRFGTVVSKNNPNWTLQGGLVWGAFRASALRFWWHLVLRDVSHGGARGLRVVRICAKVV
jgi:hypothetical protein